MAVLRNDAGMRRRLAFIGQIVISGLRWAKALAEHVHLLLGLALLAAGVTVGGLLLHRPAWFLGIFAVILLLLILGEGAYRVWHEADTRVAQPAADQTYERAETQLAGAIQSGHVLYSLCNEPSPLERQWREETEVLVREMAGDLEAARLASDNLSRRLGHLDDLADYARSNATHLTRSQSWDHHVLVMRSFRDCLAIEAREGERIRADFFNGNNLADKEMVTAWLHEIEKTFELAPALRAMASSPYPPGTGFSYEGLSAETSDLVGRLDHRLEALKPMLPLLERYVDALGEPSSDDT
jgi:predicted secreted protein